MSWNKEAQEALRRRKELNTPWRVSVQNVHVQTGVSDTHYAQLKQNDCCGEYIAGSRCQACPDRKRTYE